MKFHRINQKIKSGIAALLSLICVPSVWGALFYSGHLADDYYVRPGETLRLSPCIKATPAETLRAAVLTEDNSGIETQLRLFGVVPIKEVTVRPAEEVMLVPCGQPFGVRMLMDGIMVIGFGEVASGMGNCCPAVSAGIQEGDMIKSVNHHLITCTNDLKTAVSESGGDTLTLTIQRGEIQSEITLQPEYSIREHSWQTGLWVRDSTAGIGTMTYYEPSTGNFGGLGHPICDPDTGELIPLGSGVADTVTISGAIRGQPGIPGQLQGYFSAETPVGSLTANSRCGIFGHLSAPLSDTPAIPMAFKQEITLGEAVILTTVEGTQPKAYSARITALDYTDDTQNMMIEITDEDLLAATGGIVQGMSGSPILQNGKLVGAVTHVFVSEPSMGYGIFAETMYQTSGGTVFQY